MAKTKLGLMLAVFLTFFSAAEAKTAWWKGSYIGIQLGETHSHFSASKLGLNSADVRYQGFTGRGYLGYAFNPYFAVEAGGLPFSATRVLSINGTLVRGKVREYSFDTLVRVSYPFKERYVVFAKFGGTYLQTKPDAAVRAASQNDYRRSEVAHYRPVYGAGLGVKIHKNFILSGNWLHIQEHRIMPRGDFIAIGLEVVA